MIAASRRYAIKAAAHGAAFDPLETRMFGRKRRRREQLRRQPLPIEWLRVVERDVPYYNLLPPEDKNELLGHTQVLLAEKNFEGCGGLRLTGRVRVTVAATASILLLHRDTDYYPRLCSILVYPGAFVAETHTRDPGGLVITGEEPRVGESWQTGAIILAWDDVKHSFRHPHDGHNVILHECGHQLDQENGAADGFPPVGDRALARAWAGIMKAEYDRLTEDVELGRAHLIDDYATRSPAEFFAVVTECFFEIPLRLEHRHPDLYELFARFYKQDPALLFRQRHSDRKNIYTELPDADA